MPMLDTNEISQKIMIEKPLMLSLLGKNVLASQVRAKLEVGSDAAAGILEPLCKPPASLDGAKH